MPLSPEEIDRYRSDGYVAPRFRLDAAYVDELREALDALIRDNPGVRPEKLISAHIEGTNDEGVRGSRKFLELAMHPPILDLVEQLIGPDIILWGCHVFCKPAGDGYETPWHQDGHYWPIRPLANCTAWVALEPSTRANGCLRVIPGSHKEQRLRAHRKTDATDVTLNQELQHSEYDEAAAHDIVLEAGQVSLHDVYLLHGSEANRSAKPRRAMTLRYMPTTSVFDRDIARAQAKEFGITDHSVRTLYLISGSDRSGRNDFRLRR